MTVEKTYSCDLCNLQLPISELVGLHWDKDRHITEKAVINVEHHICLHCLDSLLEIGANKGFCELTQYGTIVTNTN